MNKEGILRTLQSIRDQIPVDLISADMDKDEALSDTRRQRAGESDKIEGIIQNLHYGEPADIKQLMQELENEKVALNQATDELEIITERMDGVSESILLYKRTIEINKNAILSSVSSDTKTLYEKTEELFSEEISKLEQELETLSKDKETLEAQVKARREKIEELKSQLASARGSRIDEIAARKAEEIAKHERNIGFLDSKAGFMVMGIATGLDRYISDYRDGKITDAQLNRYMWSIRDAVGSDEIIERFAEAAGQDVDAQSTERQARIAELTEKLNNPASYEMTDEDNEEQRKQLQALRRERDNLGYKIRRRNRAIEDREVRLNQIGHELNTYLGRSLTEQEISEVQALQSEQDALNDKVQVTIEDRNKLQEEITAKRKEIKAFSGKEFVTSKMKADQEELEKLEAEEQSASYYKRLRSMKVIDRIDEILLATGSTKEELEEANNRAKDNKRVVVVTPKATGKASDLNEAKKNGIDDKGAIPITGLADLSGEAVEENKTNGDKLADLSGEAIDEEKRKDPIAIFTPINETPIDPKKLVGHHVASAELQEKKKKKWPIIAAIIMAILAAASFLKPAEKAAPTDEATQSQPAAEEKNDEDVQEEDENEEDEQQRDDDGDDLNPDLGGDHGGGDQGGGDQGGGDQGGGDQGGGDQGGGDQGGGDEGGGDEGGGDDGDEEEEAVESQPGQVQLNTQVTDEDGRSRPEAVVNTETGEQITSTDERHETNEAGYKTVDLEEDFESEQQGEQTTTAPEDQPGGVPAKEVDYGSTESMEGQGASTEVAEAAAAEIGGGDLSSDEEVPQETASIESANVEAVSLQDLGNIANVAAQTVVAPQEGGQAMVLGK